MAISFNSAMSTSADNTNTTKTMKTSSIKESIKADRDLPAGQYLTFKFNIAGADFTAARTKDGSHVVRYMTNGVIMDSKNGAFAEFRLANADATKLVTVSAHQGEVISATSGVNLDVLEILDHQFLGQDTKFKFDLSEDEVEFIRDCEKSSLLVTVELKDGQNWASLNPQPKEYNGNSWNLAKLAVRDIRFGAPLPYGIGLSSNDIFSAIVEGHYTVADQSHRDVLAARNVTKVVNPRRARKTAQAKANHAKAQAKTAAAPVTTQAAKAAAPASNDLVAILASMNEKLDALAKENAELKEQLAVAKGQAAPAPEAPAEVAEEAPAPLFITDEGDDLADIAEADEADAADIQAQIDAADEAADLDEEEALANFDIFEDVAVDPDSEEVDASDDVFAAADMSWG